MIAKYNTFNLLLPISPFLLDMFCHLHSIKRDLIDAPRFGAPELNVMYKTPTGVLGRGDNTSDF